MQTATNPDPTTRDLTLADLPNGHYAVLRGGEWHGRLTVLRPVALVADCDDGLRHARSRHPCTDRGLRCAVAGAVLSPHLEGRVGRVLGQVDGALVAELVG